MPSLTHRPGQVSALLLLAALVLGGCGRTVAVQPLPISGPATAAACAQVVAALPEELSIGRGWQVSPDPNSTAAWSSPPVVLRCGDDVPPPGPTDQLLQVNDVTWVVAPLTDGEQYRTVDRQPGVIVTVPDRYQPTSALLTEISPAVAAGTVGAQ